jgi:hypothetical protein
VLAAAAAFGVLVAPGWASALGRQSTVRGDVASLAATTWVERHVPKSDVVVVDDYMWPDLKIDGMNPLWMWKVDGDPQVTRTELPHGWRSINYIVMTSQASAMLIQLPALVQAMAHSFLVASFTQGVTVREVLPSGTLPAASSASSASSVPPGSAWAAGLPGAVGRPLTPAPILACFVPGPWDHAGTRPPTR